MSKFKFIKSFGVLVLGSLLTACVPQPTKESAIRITTPNPLSLKVGATFDIAYETVNPENLQLRWTSSMPSTVSVTNTGKVEALKAGNAQITATLGSKTANITVEATAEISGGLNLQTSKSEITVDEYAIFTTTGQSGSANNVKYVITEGADFGAISGKNLLPNKKGTVKVVAQSGALTSNEVEITIKDSEKQTTNPYKGMTKTEFYDQYEPATSLQDAIYRSDSNFMSGSIAEQDEAPTIAANQPKENGLFVRNQTINYANNKQIYYITDTEGNIKNAVYKGGAYVILEEVAAYLFAFGDIPANYTSSKSMKPSNSPWREYLRLNHTYFSGDTSQYPYEPVLPNISGVFSRGDRYYELDIGTTGTDTGDPKYEVTDYNNGTKIVRGAARIVYTYEKDNGDKFDDPNEKHLFYTYNHYNDFQEYLNYEGGWGEMFGNITGGGELSSKINYKPTPYVETSYAYF